MVNYLRKILVISPSVHASYSTSVIAPIHALYIQSIHTSCVMSVIAPIHALPILSVNLSDDEHQEFLDEFPGTSYGEKKPSKIMAKIPDNVALTLHQVKFPEETLVRLMGKIPG